MLKFLLNYPLGYYAKSLFSPNAKGPGIALYLGGDKNMLLVQGKNSGGFTTWEPNLKTFIGAPTLTTICRSEMDMGNPNVPSSFRKEIGIPNKLQSGNDCHLVLEDSDVFIGMQNTESHKTVGSLRKALEEDPSELIPLWNNFGSQGDYHWEILDLSFRTMENREKTPQKVFLVGYPEEKIQGICRWSKLFNCQLLNILPAQIAIIKMLVNYEKAKPTEGLTHPGTYFILFNGNQETFIAFFLRGECLVFSAQKTTDGTNANEAIGEIDEIREQEELPPEIPIHLWGFKNDDYITEGLKNENWTNIKNWEVNTLMGEDPILLESNPGKITIQSPEPWLLKFLMR